MGWIAPPGKNAAKGTLDTNCPKLYENKVAAVFEHVYETYQQGRVNIVIKRQRKSIQRMSC